MIDTMKKILISLVLGVVVATAWTPRVHAAANLSMTTRLTLPVEGQTVEAQHRITVSGDGEVALELPVRAVRDATLRSAGTDASSEQVRTQEAETVHAGTRLQTTKFTFTANNGDSLILSYKTDFAFQRFGANSAALWSAYVKGAVQEKVSVTIPGKLGRPSIFGASTNDSSFGGGTTTLDFATREMTTPIKLLFGSNALWELNWSSSSLKNSSWWFQTRHVILPPDTNQQRVWLESVSPAPRRLFVDRDGNLIAEYRLWPKRTITLSAKSYVDSRALFYNTSNTRPLADVPAELRDYTLGNAKLADDTQVLGQVRKAYDEAVKAARGRKGDTERITSDGQKIIVELSEKLRRGGIPTREVSGVSLASREQLLGSHQASSWVEVYVPGTGWMTVDPLSEQYGQADPLHIGLVIFGVPSPVPLSAQIDGLSLQSYGQPKLPEPQLGNTEVSMNRFIVVPGLSINRTFVNMPAGVVVDNAATTADGRQMAFGSLAPLQKIGRWSASVGSQSWRGGTIEFGRGGEQGLGDKLSQGIIRTNYSLAIAEVLLLILGSWWIIRRRRRGGSVGKVPSLEKQVADDTIATDDLLRRN
jgi:hypothetical protein